MKEKFDRHMATAHNPAWIESHTQSVAAAQPPFKRKIVLVPDISNLTLGFTKSKAKLYPCQECNKVYSSEGELEGHIERGHPKVRQWPRPKKAKK